MDSLKTTTALVKHILTVCKKARNNDSFLYFMVIRHEAKAKGIDFHDLSVADFLLKRKALGFTCPETVRRARQKIQASYPELAACKKVQSKRLKKEAEYRAFAKEVI